MNVEPTHWERPWCWERLRAWEGGNRGWDGWMASSTQRTWVWVNSRSWWWTGRPGMLQSMGSQRVRHNWVTELNWSLSVFWLLVYMHAQLLSCVWFFETPMTLARQAPLSMEFPRHWSGLPFHPPGDLPNPGVKLISPSLAGWFFTTEQFWVFRPCRCINSSSPSVYSCPSPLVVSLYFLPPFSLTMKPVAGLRAHSYPAVIRSLVGYICKDPFCKFTGSGWTYLWQSLLWLSRKRKSQIGGVTSFKS